MMYAEDRPGASALRAAVRDEHLAYLEEHAGIVLVGGALLADDSPTRVGSCLIVNLPSRAAVQQWLSDEPFNKAGLFARITVTRMRNGQLNPSAAPATPEGN